MCRVKGSSSRHHRNRDEERCGFAVVVLVLFCLFSWGFVCVFWFCLSLFSLLALLIGKEGGK